MEEPPNRQAPPAAQTRASPRRPRRPRAARSADEQEDGSLEFTLPPGELDRIFVEAAPRPAESAAPAAPAQGTEPIRGEGARGRVAGLEVPEDVRREMLEGMNQELLLPQIQAPAHRPLPFALWLGAALVLALLLGAQMIHENRGWLATHAPGPLHGLYVALGVASPAAATLSAYQLRQWGVTGDPSASGTLRVRASILNTSPQLQPYPLLRVTLANRFGARIGTRDFEPAEYMGKPIARMLAPGERADATLDIVDPGKDAEGFEIDVCLRSIEQKISCAGDAAAQPGAAQPVRPSRSNDLRAPRLLRPSASMTIKIGAHVLPSNVVLAPMAGVTDRPFRMLCRRFGAGLAASEMLTADVRLWDYAEIPQAHGSQRGAESARRADRRLRS